jgi:hypothetical protein
MSRKTSRAASMLAMTAALSMSLGVTPPSTAASNLVSFEFTTHVDATSVGGSDMTPLRIIYQFDPALAPGTGGTETSETNASYGPAAAIILELGTECAGTRGGGTELGVFNDAGPIEDSYDVRAEGSAVAGKTLFGETLYFFRILLVDSDATMFSDTTLPLTTTFAQEADFQQTEIVLSIGRDDQIRIAASEETPFQLQSFDLSGSISGLIDDVKALPVSSSVIQKLIAPLERARTLLQGALTQKAVTQASEALDEFRKVVQNNRTRLGQETVNQLTSSSMEISSRIPDCGA